MGVIEQLKSSQKGRLSYERETTGKKLQVIIKKITPPTSFS